MFVNIPGYREAVIKEQSERDNAFIDEEESICGIEVLQLNTERLMILKAIENPFVCGGKIEPCDILMALWVISKQFCRNKTKRDAFIKKHTGIQYSESVNELLNYFDKAFFDGPKGKGGSGSIASFAACLVNKLATAYGWSESEILAIPLKRIWQYVRLINEKDGDKSFINPSDIIKMNFIDDLNKGKFKLEDYAIRGNSS